MKRTFSLWTAFNLLTIGLLMLGWIVDRSQLQRRTKRQLRQLELATALHLAIHKARGAQDPESFENASRDGTETMRSLKQERVESDLSDLVGLGYLEAVRTPQRFDVDWSLSANGVTGIASLGRKGLPLVSTLLSDSDPRVRDCGVDTLRYLVDPNTRNLSVVPLSPNEMPQASAVIKKALLSEKDDELVKSLQRVLELSELKISERRAREQELD
jgi:hypothetical protein